MHTSQAPRSRVRSSRLLMRYVTLLVCGWMSMSAVAQTTATSGIERQDIRAQLRATQYATLASELGARIKSLPVKEGGRFAQGDVLIELDCSVQDAQKIKAQAELDGATHTLRANEQMRALKSVGALEVALAKSARDRAAAELLTITSQIEKCTIKAPFTGVMGERKVQQHEFIQAGQAVLDVFDDSLFEVEFLTPSKWITWLKTGLSFDIEIDELKIVLPVTLTRLGARIDPVSQSMKVTGQIKNPSGDLKPGMSGQVLFK